MTYWIWLLVMLSGLALVPAISVAAAIDVMTDDSRRANITGIVVLMALVGGAIAAMYLL